MHPRVFDYDRLQPQKFMHNIDFNLKFKWQEHSKQLKNSFAKLSSTMLSSMISLEGDTDW